MNLDMTRGSEWHKWDLHVHTASSYDAYHGKDANELIVNEWKRHEFAAVAITDHFVIDEKRILDLAALAPEITIFPGVELRTDKGGINIHPILIFSEQINLSELAESFRIFKREKGKAIESNNSIYWDYNDIIAFAENHKAIISVHAGSKANGVDRSITNALHVGQAVKNEYANSVHIFEVGKLQDVDDYKQIVFKKIEERPVIICSDNHDPRDYALKEFLWIKANPTFNGLQQVLIHPSERVYIGNIPPKLDKVAKRPSSYIQKIEVSKIPNPTRPFETWFNFELPLNPGLVAIIGNKGSGKSALSDIIGHLCKCKTMKHCSFLNEKRFRKEPEVIAKDYIGKITWYDGDTYKLSLNTKIYDTTIENAQYLPQQFIESVCNNLDNSFQKEINSVIFSYIEKEEKHNAESLDHLKEIISKSYYIEIDELKSAIKAAVNNLINCEDLLSEEHKRNVEDNLKKKKEELEKHSKLKPKKIEKPQNAQNENYQKEIALVDEKIVNLECEIAKCQESLKCINEKINEIHIIEQKLKSADEYLKRLNSELKVFSEKYALNSNTMTVSYSLPSAEIYENINVYTNEKADITLKLYGNKEEIEDNESLLQQLKRAKENKEKIVSSADATEKAFQKYLQDNKEWEDELKKLKGDKGIENSVAYFEEKLRYITEDLEKDYVGIKNDLLQLSEQIFEKKKKISSRLLELYSPVRRELETVLDGIEEKIEFDIEISLRIEPSMFSEDILQHIYKNRSGEFYGERQAASIIQKLIDETDFGKAQNLTKFISVLYDKLANDFGLIKDRKVFYEYLFFLDYLDINFVLKLGGRPLQNLSAGEKGIVLLVFYLALNKNEIPLIIDQPEDNLDNQSVYSKLVACISKAKLRRQVIIVTHNPNIAIACDAEQIIYCTMDKNESRIYYQSNALENNITKEHVVNVLEGTMPAFNLRRKKYGSY